MATRRFITCSGAQVGLSFLAKKHGLAPGTLSDRLNRFGESPTGLARALATGVMTRRQSGLIGATRSPWSLKSM